MCSNYEKCSLDQISASVDQSRLLMTYAVVIDMRL